jgi:hypothetical protein
MAGRSAEVLQLGNLDKPDPALDKAQLWRL